MKIYFSSVRKLARPRVVLLLCALLFGAYALLNFTHLPFSILSLQAASGGHTILNVLPHYDATSAYEYIAAYTPEAIRIYHSILALDVLLLIPLYVAFLATGLLHAGGLVLRKHVPALLLVLAALPLIAGILNLIEDGIIAYLLGAYPLRHDSLAAMSGFITTTKSTLITLSMLAVAFFYTIVAFSRTSFFFGLRKCHI